jgi:hypothetical protein
MANTKVTGDLIASGTITAANLVSGTLDGILGTYLSTNSYATESYVTTAVSNLIDAAPASLDTLNELAAALNDDANFATTVTDSIATKLPLAGGNITGNLSVNTNALFVDAANNWVGIGTSSPSRPIHILAPTPGIKLEDTTGNDFGEIVSVDGDLYIRADEGATQADSSIRFQIDQSERVRIDSSGNVGIGTSPDSDAELHVYRNASAARVRVEREFNPKLDLESLSGYAQIGTLNNFPLAFQTNGAERMRITSSGNVGIGTSNADYLLTAFGNAQRIGLKVPSAAEGWSDTDLGGFVFRTHYGTQERAGMYAVGNFATDTYQPNLVFRTSAVDRLVIKSNGYVGIGTSSPASLLHIYNSSSAEIKLETTAGSALLRAISDTLVYRGDSHIFQSEGGTERLRIASSGNVGIGTVTPDNISSTGTILSISKSGALTTNDILGSLTFITTDPSYTVTYADGVTAEISSIAESATGAAYGLAFSTGTISGSDRAERMRINSSGRVGIGTSTPAQSLDVVGNIQFSGRIAPSASTATAATPSICAGFDYDTGIFNPASNTMAFSTAGTERMRINSSGNVGIGTSSTIAKAHIQGGDVIASLTDWNTKSNTAFSLANPAVRIGVGYNASDIPLIQGFDTSNAARNIGLQVYGGNVGIGISSPATKVDIAKDDIVDGVTLRLTNTHNGSDWGLGSKLGVIDFYSSDTSSVGVKGSIELEQSSAGTTNPSETDFVFKNFSSGSLSEKMRINSSGTLLLNGGIVSVSTPVENGTAQFKTLNANTAPPSEQFYVGNNLGDVDLGNKRGALKFFTGTTERMRVTSSGNVGIGGAPDTLFHVNGGSTFPIVKINASALTSRSLFLGMDDAVSHFINAQGSGSNLLLKTGSVERMRITSGGEVLLAGLTDNTPNGEPATGQLVSYSDGSKYAILVAANSTSGRSMIAFSNPNGIVGEIVSSGSSTAYNTSSDYRLKENVVPMEGALDRVDALKPSRFNFIADADKTVDGFIAHEVQAIVPEAVTGEKDAVDADGNPIYQGIDQSKLVPLLVGAIQELKNIVDQQQIEIETLKAQING